MKRKEETQAVCGMTGVWDVTQANANTSVQLLGQTCRRESESETVAAWSPDLSHTKVVLTKLISTQIRQLILCISNSKG